MRFFQTASAIFTLAAAAGCSTVPPVKSAEPIRFAGENCAVFDPNTKEAALSEACLRMSERNAQHKATCEQETQRLKNMTDAMQSMFENASKVGNTRIMNLGVILLTKKADEVQLACGISPNDREYIFGQKLTPEQISAAAAVSRAALSGNCRTGPSKNEVTCKVLP